MEGIEISLIFHSLLVSLPSHYSFNFLSRKIGMGKLKRVRGERERRERGRMEEKEKILIRQQIIIISRIKM